MDGERHAALAGHDGGVARAGQDDRLGLAGPRKDDRRMPRDVGRHADPAVPRVALVGVNPFLADEQRPRRGRRAVRRPVQPQDEPGWRRDGDQDNEDAALDPRRPSRLPHSNGQVRPATEDPAEKRALQHEQAGDDDHAEPPDVISLLAWKQFVPGSSAQPRRNVDDGEKALCAYEVSRLTAQSAKMTLEDEDAANC